jgi:hypothetical protein
MVGIGGGAALGLLKGPASAAAAVPPGPGAAVEVPGDEFVAAGLTVQEAPEAPAAVRKVVRKVVAQPSAGRAVTSGGAPLLSVNVPGSPAASTVASNANCGAKLDDAKINWLLNLVGKAKASNPDQAATADRIAGQLRSAMGKNMCAEEAQVHISNMCADKGTKEFMALMVKELPFFVRPLVGDPCKHDLVEAANRWLPSS